MHILVVLRLLIIGFRNQEDNCQDCSKVQQKIFGNFTDPNAWWKVFSTSKPKF